MRNNREIAASPSITYLLGWALIGVCLVLSLALITHYFGILNLPGCGDVDTCGRVGGRSGTIGVWPISFISLSYFSGLAVVWWKVAQEGATPSLVWLARTGAIVSVCCLLLGVWEWAVCLYCWAIHLANLGVWLVTERQSGGVASWRPLITHLAIFGVISAFLNVARVEQNRRVAWQKERDELRLANALDPMLNTSEPPAGQPANKIAGIPPELENGELPGKLTADDLPKAAQTAEPAEKSRTSKKRTASRPREPFRVGSADAPVQLVVFFDYQSTKCLRLEREIQTLISRYPGTLAMTIRHYPFCKECNPSIKSNLHPLACQAALAAEAAGVLQGADGFWKMHRWLVKQQGAATAESLQECWLELGFEDSAEFAAMMSRSDTLQRVMRDIVDGQLFEVSLNSFVLINGERTASGDAEGAIVRAVKAVIDNPLSSDASKPSSGPFSSELRAVALRATVQIGNTADESDGSGVIVAQKGPYVYILTASHVVQGAKGLEVRIRQPDSDSAPPKLYTIAEILSDSPDADLALLRLATRDPMPGILTICPRQMTPTERLFPALTTGYSGLDEKPTCQTTHVAGMVMLRRQAGEKPARYWQVNSETEEGRSGGALIDKQGRLIGIASGVSNGKGYFCHLSAIERLLAANGMKWLLEE